MISAVRRTTARSDDGDFGSGRDGVGAAFLGLRVLFGKDEEVRKPGCSNANAFMDQQEACPVCGVAPGQSCPTEPASAATPADTK